MNIVFTKRDAAARKSSQMGSGNQRLLSVAHWLLSEAEVKMPKFFRSSKILIRSSKC